MHAGLAPEVWVQLKGPLMVAAVERTGVLRAPNLPVVVRIFIALQ